MTGLAARLAAVGLLLPVAAFMLRGAPSYFPGRDAWPWLLVLGLALVVGAGLRVRQRHGGSAGTVDRWSRRSRRNDGVASSWAILRHASGFAMRRKAKVLRPSLRRLHFWERLRVSPRNYATPLARVGLLRVWSPCEDVTLRIGGPRTGKTGELAGRILDAPGAVIATSTRTDLIDLTSPCRERLGPVLVFNPAGVGALESTVVFDPLSGCDDPRTATYRAADLLAAVNAAGSNGDREFWVGQARRVLASLLHAAALGDAGMRDVLSWVADPDAFDADILAYLRRSPEPAFQSDAAQFLKTNQRTRSSILSTIMPALGWLTDSVAAAAAGANGDRTANAGFDVAALLDESGTVYMLGAEDAQTAPLVCALTGHIARQARVIAARQPSGRLDPPLTLALDEAALICPVPLDNWTADMGGRGVTIHIAVQSRAQLRQRWGDNGAAAILNNSATLLVYGGFKDADDLAAFSTLTGERDEPVATYDGQHTRTGISYRRVPVLSPAQIAQLPARRVVIIRRGMAPAVGRVQMAWKRRDVRTTNRRVRRAAQVERLAATYRDLAAQASAWVEDISDETPARIRPHLRAIARGLSGQLPDRPAHPAAKEPTTDA